MLSFIIGQFAGADAEALRAASQRGGADARLLTPQEARELLLRPDAEIPHAIVVDRSTEGTAEMIPWIRGEARYFAVPIIALVSQADDRVYTDAFGVGADDVIVLSDRDALARRIQKVASFDPNRRHEPTRGTAMVAEARGDRRRAIGRLLRRSGFDVAFAASGDELVSTIAAVSNVRVVVLSESLGDRGVLSVLHAARAAAADPKLPAVILAAASARALAREAKGAIALAVGSERTSIDNLLFLVNEVTRRDVSELRKSRRLLFSTLCAFRKAGEMFAAHGFVYNISKDGLYIRSLDVPECGSQVWVELRPPKSSAVVHLRGTVRWTLSVGVPALPAPPGFGLRLDQAECPARDLASYEEAYAQHGGRGRR